jgi:hypothetical protein
MFTSDFPGGKHIPMIKIKAQLNALKRAMPKFYYIII